MLVGLERRCLQVNKSPRKSEAVALSRRDGGAQISQNHVMIRNRHCSESAATARHMPFLAGTARSTNYVGSHMILSAQRHNPA